MAWSLNPDNGGGGGTAVWDKARSMWKAAGIQDFPWMHVRSMDDLQRLLSVGEAKDSPALGVNIEDIVGDKLSLQEIGGFLLDFWVNRYSKAVHMPTLDWVQNGQGWNYVSFATVALEFFPGEGNMKAGYNSTVAHQCFDHAQSEGLPQVTAMFKTGGQTPQTYGDDYSICHSLYTADDIPPTEPGWNAWKAPTPCTQVSPPIPEVPKMLSVTKFPYTGPLKPGVKNRATVKGLKRAMVRMRYLKQELGSETDDFGPALATAFKVYAKEEFGATWTQYGLSSWNALRAAKLTQGPNAGQYAMDSKALAYVREDALKQCYPHPAGVSGTYVGQGPHQTDGLPWVNIAIDFMAPGGTKVLAVENATITRLSGRDPAWGVIDPPGVFGWTIYYDTPAGYHYFSTHYGKRLVTEGQQVDCGQPIGEVGRWPGDSGRSHTHLGVSSPLGRADATKRILEISQAKHVTV